MIKLESLDNVLLSSGIKDLSPIQHESIKVVNKLLDGSQHVQIIGDYLKSIEFVVRANHNQAHLITQAEATGQPLKLIIDDRHYIGLLDREPSWQRLTMRHKDTNNIYYISSLKLYIDEEGEI